LELFDHPSRERIWRRVAQMAERPKSIRGSNAEMCNDSRFHEYRPPNHDRFPMPFDLGNTPLKMRPPHAAG